MKRLFILFFLLFGSLTAFAAQKNPDWQEVEKAFDRKGTMKGDVLKITFPRSDLKVKMDRVTVEPGLALTSWIAFKRTADQTMMMGDLVLLTSEVPLVMSKLVAARIEITGLHNHLLGETPNLMYMHFTGMGDPVQLAGSMKEALSLTGTPMGSPPQQQPSQPQPLQKPAPVDWSKVESILGWKGERKGNLLQLGIPREEKITEEETEIPPFMGTAISINFQTLTQKTAATTGDFVLLASEVNPVVKALTENGIAVTAIHSHMLSESPRLFFLHFWGVDNTEKLARGLGAALDKVNYARKE